MAFVRAKQLRGKTYYALVENHREGGKVRQKVLASLGDSGDLLAALDRYQWLAKTCNTYAVYQVERFLRARETYYRKQYAEKLGAFWNRQAPKPEPVSVAALADADWQRKAEAEKSKPAEYLRIAEAIENFAKVWTDRRGLDGETRQVSRTVRSAATGGNSILPSYRESISGQRYGT
jgi:hypothetical protein